MFFVCHRRIVAATALLLLYFTSFSRSSTLTITAAPNAASSLPGTCEFRTINYITDTLPQQCGKSSWSHANATMSTRTIVGDEAIATGGEPKDQTPLTSHVSSQETAQPSSGSETISTELLSSMFGEPLSTSNPPASTHMPDVAADELEPGELDDASFLSFEDWKKQTLEKSGQQNQNIGNKRSGEKRKDSESFQNNLDSLGEEGELDLDFSAFRTGGNDDKHQQSGVNGRDNIREVAEDVPKHSDQHRNTDAGKTCKERFSYASFDAGATIVKSHPGAQNPKAVLIENKDTYMLSECKIENKFIIIELSEDIWIDTLVLANYEFFSSMVRTFRVSVSDRYPVKTDKWKDLGIHEARNSREIQAFLIENPQIWARYLRIEFLNHYGNEYYCPLSLVRVHGARLLESWKDSEANGDEDESSESGNQVPEDHFIPEAVADVVQREERLSAELKEAQAMIHDMVKTAAALASDHEANLTKATNTLKTASSHVTSPWTTPGLLEFGGIFNTSLIYYSCLVEDAPITQAATLPAVTPIASSNATVEHIRTTSKAPTPPPAGALLPSLPSPVAQSEELKLTAKRVASSLVSSIQSVVRDKDAESTASTASTAASVTNKSKTSSTTPSASPLPTIQESFFKAVSRRLQLLETNSTLSLKYIEEQSKILREAFSKVEKKQLQKTNRFLDTLNSTVLAELRVFRQQYDEIWQSTVISLESQREESRREILAISSRLTILADEVIFQKRMSIVQSVLLLLCLGLVIFSRVSAAGHLDMPSFQSRARSFGFPLSPHDSPPESPEFRRTSSTRERNEWLDPDERRPSVSRSLSREDSPPTPISAYSRSDNALTPPSDDLTGSTGKLDGSTSDYLSPPLPRQRSARTSSATWDEGIEDPEPTFISSSPIRTPKKRKAFIRQQASPPPSWTEEDSELLTESQGNVEAPQPASPPSQRERTLSSASYPSPPPGNKKRGFSIVRKPLPALPPDCG